MASTATTAAPRSGARVQVQKFGTFLSNMVMPNIGAFIAWGLITALFIEVGWITLIGDRSRRMARARRAAVCCRSAAGAPTPAAGSSAR